MPKVIAMIPVLLGSKRIPDKNIILVDGRVLCSYTIEACLEADVFTGVYLNSEDKIFEPIAEKEGVKFHHRPADFGGKTCQQKTKSRDCAGQRCVINEHYLYQFMTQYPDADYICQINATSPLLKSSTIKRFVKKLAEGNYDCLFATEEIRAETFFKDEPLTFSRKIKIPSNEIDPLKVICWAIAGWRRDAYVRSYERDDLNENGPVFTGKLGLYPIDEREALDIDHWSTLDVVEKFIKAQKIESTDQWKYLDGRTADRK